MRQAAPAHPTSRRRCRPRLGGLLNGGAPVASHGPDGSIPSLAARPWISQATSGSWERGATSLCHEHRRRRGRRTRAPVAASHGRAASPPGRKAVWLDARGEDGPGPLVGTVQRAWVHGPVLRPVEPFRPVLPVANAGLGQRAARPPAARGWRIRRRGRARRSRSCRAARWGGSTGRTRAPYICTRSPLVAPHTSPSRRLRTFPLPVAPTRANVDGRRLPAAATTRRTRVHDPARDRLDHHLR